MVLLHPACFINFGKNSSLRGLNFDTSHQCLLFCKVTGISSISERKYQKFRLGRDSVLKPFGIQVWITVWYEVNNMQWSGKVKITKALLMAKISSLRQKSQRCKFRIQKHQF